MQGSDVDIEPIPSVYEPRIYPIELILIMDFTVEVANVIFAAGLIEKFLLIFPANHHRDLGTLIYPRAHELGRDQQHAPERLFPTRSPRVGAARVAARMRLAFLDHHSPVDDF